VKKVAINETEQRNASLMGLKMSLCMIQPDAVSHTGDQSPTVTRRIQVI
jgi:hypothetical protein